MLALWLALRRAPIGAAFGLLGRVSPTLIAVALVLHVTRIAAAAGRWSYVTSDFGPGWWRRSGRNVLVGFAMNNTLPARAGDVARVVLGRNQTGGDAVLAGAFIVIEKAFDVMALLLLGGVGVVGCFTRVGWFALLPIAAFLGVAAALPSAALAPAPLMAEASGDPDDVTGVRRLVKRLLDSLKVASRALGWRRLIGLLWWSLVVWTIEGATYVTVLAALGVSLPVPGGALIVGAGNLVGLVPALPGAWGTFELAVQGVLGRLSVPAADAFAGALLIHLLIFLPATVVGGYAAGAALVASGGIE